MMVYIRYFFLSSSSVLYKFRGALHHSSTLYNYYLLKIHTNVYSITTQKKNSIKTTVRRLKQWAVGKSRYFLLFSFQRFTTVPFITFERSTHVNKNAPPFRLFVDLLFVPVPRYYRDAFTPDMISAGTNRKTRISLQLTTQPVSRGVRRDLIIRGSCKKFLQYCSHDIILLGRSSTRLVKSPFTKKKNSFSIFECALFPIRRTLRVVVPRSRPPFVYFILSPLFEQ